MGAGWILRNGKQQKLQQKGNEKLLDPAAKAWADSQVTLSKPMTAAEAEKWDRAYLAARSEQKSQACYEDDKVDGIIKNCHAPTIASVKLVNEPKPCDPAYWKEVIQKVSGKKVGKSHGYQFFYIRDGMYGLDTPFLKSNDIAASRNQDNVTWDEEGLQFHSSVGDALVIFDDKGDLVDVYRLSVPIVADVGYEGGPDRIVDGTLTQSVVDTWDGIAMYVYHNKNYEYTAIYPMDPYKTKPKGRYWVDIHGSKYTYGCIEIVENLQKDAAGNCLGMQDTTGRSSEVVEELPNNDWLPKVASGQSKWLGTIFVIPPKR